MSRCDLNRCPVDLESSLYIKRHVINSVRNLSEIEQSPAELLIILRIFVSKQVNKYTHEAHYV